MSTERRDVLEITNRCWVREDLKAVVLRGPPNDGWTWYAMVTRDDLLRSNTEIRKLRAALENAVDKDTPGTDAWHDAKLRGLLLEVPPTPEHIEQWGEDVAMYTWNWHAPQPEGE